ncbi:PD-(D/E)XK nuclease superfamily protein [Chitinophaga sp. YR573]|uniref:RecB family exonuclease n=1 Tax=Chitinophaga sp. YR573 TaxID=1881040 RepID=UPI0008B40FDA|nr:PD-(D/E)XK nuclease family protein [Chitinophaga sp. YR573]SEW12523.1 PD-(D/E)XK nuclease superfamily protein [Chitinophaga sp. YR573]
MSTDQYEHHLPEVYNLPKQPFARKVLTIMRYIACELDTPYSGDDLLFSILHFDFFNIPAEEIAKVSRRVAERGYKDKTSLRQYLKEWHNSHGLTMFTPAAEQAMMEFSPLLESWIRAAQQVSLQQLFTIIINEERISRSLRINEEDSHHLPEIVLFNAFIAEEVLREPTLTLIGFMNKIDEIERVDNVLPSPILSPEIPAMDPLFINPLLSGFMMNVTALNNYLDCPLGFFYKSIIRAPYGRSESMEFGSAVHHAVEKLFQKMQDNDTNTFPSTEEFIEDFLQYMTRNPESFTKEAFERRLQYGREILTNYYNTYISQWNKVVSVERNIRNVLVSGVPLKGKIDKLEFDGNKVNLVDYKTGSYEKAAVKLHKFDPPGEYTPNGGDYWRQAVFYKILLDNYKQKNWQVTSTEFDFIEPDTQNIYRKEKVTITPADVTTVTQQIVSTWNKIQEKDFYTGCGKANCRWCNFVKENNLYITLHQ